MKKFYFVYPAVLIISMMFYGFGDGNSRYPSGSPAGYTGSPFDGKDCTVCHNGTAITVDDWITSNVPEAGYAPGETYEITVTVPGSGKKGYQVSPHNDSGELLGSIIAGSGSKLVGDDKYITHSSKVSSDPAVWVFEWVAPAEETGDVVFYGAFAINENKTRLSSLLIPEDITISINEEVSTKVKVFPNPVGNKLQIDYQLKNTSKVSAKIYNLEGKLMADLGSETQEQGLQTINYNRGSEITAGIYILVLDLDSEQIIRKIMFR